MHYHCEILLPPAAEDIEKAVTEVMAPFDEDLEGDDSRGGLWDYWVIGGRWSGEHAQSGYSPERMRAFYKALEERAVTVSGLQFGKQTLDPATQIPEVDRLWREMFPESGLEVCPIFDHSPDQLTSDICKVSELGEFARAATLIIARPDHSTPGAFYPQELLLTSLWNGITWQDTTWDGLILPQIEAHNESVGGSRNPEWSSERTVTEDWFAVTVDYHS